MKQIKKAKRAKRDRRDIFNIGPADSENRLELPERVRPNIPTKQPPRY